MCVSVCVQYNEWKDFIVVAFPRTGSIDGFNCFQSIDAYS